MKNNKLKYQMVNITLNLEWSYSKYVLITFFTFLCTTFFSSASILESLVIGGISGVIAFSLDKIYKIPSKIMDKVKTHNESI
jgi:uncharacterized membrane protein (DUF485 family)